MSRPALPRASSATSGFFFCGMIEQPVDQASSSCAQPNSREVQRQISSPRRDRCTPIIAVTKQNSGDEVAVAHGVDRVRDRVAEAELVRDRLRVERQRRAGERAGAHGRQRRTPVPVAQPVDVAAEARARAWRARGRTTPAARAAGA